MLQLKEKLKTIAYCADLCAKAMIYIAITILLAVPVLALGNQPLEVLRQAINKGISVLEDPQYQDANQKDEQVQKLWEVTQEIFDFKEFFRHVLTSHWDKFTSPQREKFVELIGIFLGKLYLYKLQTEYTGEKVSYNGQKIMGKSRALVEITVFWKNMKLPVKLRMKKSHGRWKVYDISAIGIRAVVAYRAQFDSALQKKSPERVIELIREKIRKLEKDL